MPKTLNFSGSLLKKIETNSLNNAVIILNTLEFYKLAKFRLLISLLGLGYVQSLDPPEKLTFSIVVLS